MKKLSLQYLLILTAFVGLFASCGKDDPEPQPTTPDACAAATFPATTGTANVSFVNFPGDGMVTIDANAGDILSIAVRINKGSGNRPQKLRVYQTDCINAKGTVVNFQGQPETEDQGNTIDLRNVDEQVRTVLYTVPTGMSPIYLNFEVDESGSAYTYKRMQINVSGSGIVDTWTGVTLGAQSNALPSRMSSSTGYVYLACETAANINTIDITFASTGANGSYLSSNPARFESPIGLQTKTRDCGPEGVIRTDGGNPTYFGTPSGVNFDNVTEAQLEALNVSSSNSQYINVNQGGVYSFLNAQGKKGLVRVTQLTEGANGTITLDVKVQR